MMPAPARPTSPHWQVYRWQIGNTLSILHRLTGVALALGLIAVSYWFVALASGPQSYAAAMRGFASPLGMLVMMGWAFAFSSHLLNGVRRLLWDRGVGFGRPPRHASGWLAVLGAVGLTLGVWALIWAN